MFQLLTSPRAARNIRGLLGTITDAVRSVVAPASLVEAPAVETVPDPADVLTADELPAVETIEAAAHEYERAADQARRADRSKRASKKILDRLPAGVYGMYRVFRTPSSRQTPDLAAITAIFKANGLGPVPMKACAPSLKVELIEAAPVAAEFAVLASV